MIKKFALGTLLGVSVAFAGSILPNNELQLGLLAQAAEKKLIVLSNMHLNGDMKQKFGNLYDEFQKSLTEIRVKKLQVIQAYAKDYTKLDDKAAAKLLDDWMKLQKEALDIKQKYISAFKKILPPSLVLRFYQIENRLELVQEAKVSAMIPLAIPEEAMKKMKAILEANQKERTKAPAPASGAK
jgi:hypothetical protein